MEYNNNNPEIGHGSDKEQEIDLMELACKLWDNRRTIIKWCIGGLVVGLVVAFCIPREYSTTVKLTPELRGKSAGGGMSALASLAGVNLGSDASVDAVYPELYPDVLNSTPFMVELLSASLPTEENDMTVQEIITKHTSSPWWSSAISAVLGLPSLFRSQPAVSDTIDPYHLTTKQAATVLKLSNRISADFNTKKSVITISTTLQDPVASAHLADTVVAYLQKYITEYRTEKARQDLAYALRINGEAREAYYDAQKRYAEASDRNHSLSSRSASIEIERLQNEATLAFDLYNSTAQRVQMAEAKVQETTPVFAVIQPASVPVKPAKPSKLIILIGTIFLAFVASSAYILCMPILKASMSKHKK